MSKEILLCVYTLLLLSFAAARLHQEEDKNGLLEMKVERLIGLVEKLTKENEQLRDEIDHMKHQHRGIEDDVEQIKLVLVSHGEDLTSLRIEQGHLQETVVKHDSDLVNVNNCLDKNAGQLAGHDQVLSEHQTSIERPQRQDPVEHRRRQRQLGQDSGESGINTVKRLFVAQNCWLPSWVAWQEQ